MRSAKAPVIRAGVMIAKVIWKVMNTLSGIVPLQRIRGHAVEKQPRQVAQIGPVAGEREAVADHRPDHGRQAAGRERLHADREHVLLAHHAAVEQRQARHGHHQHQRRRRQHPGGVAGIQGGRLVLRERAGARRQQRRQAGDQAQGQPLAGSERAPDPARHRSCQHRHLSPLNGIPAGRAADGSADLERQKSLPCRVTWAQPDRCGDRHAESHPRLSLCLVPGQTHGLDAVEFSVRPSIFVPAMSDAEERAIGASTAHILSRPSVAGLNFEHAGWERSARRPCGERTPPGRA